MSAEAEIKSFIERVLRLKEEMDKQRPAWIAREYAIADRTVGARMPGPNRPRSVALDAGIGVKAAREVLDICGRLTWAGKASEDFSDDRMGFTIACRLTGLSWQDIQKAMGDVRHYGPERSALAWAAYMAEPDSRIIGHVYSAHSPEISGLVKVGFSRNPEKRMRSLTRQHQCQVILGRVFAGTMLHEWALHQILFRTPIPEWHPVDDIPHWLMPPCLLGRRAA